MLEFLARLRDIVIVLALAWVGVQVETAREEAPSSSLVSARGESSDGQAGAVEASRAMAEADRAAAEARRAATEASAQEASAACPKPKAVAVASGPAPSAPARCLVDQGCPAP
jgi:hypothetical protein